MRFPALALGILTGAILFTTVSVIIAWTGPTSPPPSGNVDAPLNVGSTDQIKNAGLGLDALAVFGNAILSGPSVTYLNFGTVPGASGYGIRDNAGTMEFKNSGGSWGSIATNSSITSAIQNFFSSSQSNQVDEINFSDGTTQTTASAGIAPGTLCGMATASSNSSTPPPLTSSTLFGSTENNWTNVSPCNSVNVASSCPSGYTQTTWKTGVNTVPQTCSALGNCSGGTTTYYFARSCVKN